jgi:4-aminobutyrate aminotransferase-like enzyme
VTGNYLRTGLSALMHKHAIIGDVRGVGQATGVELVRDRRTKEPAGHETSRLLGLLRDAGVLIGSDGVFGNVLKIRPPIVFTRAHADIAIAAVDQALSKL